MTTQNELTRSKRHLKNTLRMKRLSTLQRYNFLRHKNEKISFDLFLKNFTRLNNMILSTFEADVNDSSLSDSEKVELTKNHKPLSIETKKNTDLKYLFAFLYAAKTKFDIAFQLDELSYSLFNRRTYYKIHSDTMTKKEFIALKQKYLIQIIKVCI